MRTAITLAALSACGGAVWTESSADGDGFLAGDGPAEETGAQAHDGYCAWIGTFQVSAQPERGYAELQEADVDCADGGSMATRHSLVTLDARGQSLRKRIPAYADPRLLFGDDEVVLMGEVDGVEQLTRMDPATLDTLAVADVGARYWGTRTSPSRRFVAVGDNAADVLPIHLIDLSTLATATLDPGTSWAEVQWLNTSDRLVGLIAEAWIETDDVGGAVIVSEEGSTPRLALWDLEGFEGLTPETAAVAPAPVWEVSLPDSFVSTLFSYSWIGVDPLDRYVAFPLRRADGTDAIAVADVADGAVRWVEGVSGPVAFTPDGGAFVGWSTSSDEGASLIVVDTLTLDRQVIPLPTYIIPSYFVSHDGAQVLVASALGEAELSIVDTSTGEVVPLGRPGGLWSFTSRLGHDEVWMTGTAPVEGASSELWRLDLLRGDVQTVDVGWSPGQVVWFPTSDLLLLDDTARARMVLWDPDRERVAADLDLSTP